MVDPPFFILRSLGGGDQSNHCSKYRKNSGTYQRSCCDPLAKLIGVLLSCRSLLLPLPLDLQIDLLDMLNQYPSELVAVICPFLRPIGSGAHVSSRIQEHEGVKTFTSGRTAFC